MLRPSLKSAHTQSLLGATHVRMSCCRVREDVSDNDDYHCDWKRRLCMESENVGIETLTECDYGAISPEALPGEAWVKHTTWDDSRELCESNGNTNAPPSDD